MEDLRVPLPDESGSIVKVRFQQFLQEFRSPDDALDDISTQQRLLSDYMLQISFMIQNNKSTLFVNFRHIIEMDHELAEAIELEYYRFETYLRHALQDVIAIDNQHYIFDVDKGQREFFVSFYNLPCVEKIRGMSTDKIGRLISISGTVTRSSEVRPELFYGAFMCNTCNTSHPHVEQQFQYTQPQVCKNPDCPGTQFQIVIDKSSFVDWQRLRVQENADEIPPGSMPRCVDVICRNEIVEVAKAGDKVILTGCVTVIPDTTGLARVGESTMSQRTIGRGDSADAGATGLRKLGCKEMTYKMNFVACNVQHMSVNASASAAGGNHIGNATLTASDIGLVDRDGTNGIDGADGDSLELTDTEKRDILSMRNTPHLYNKMVESICPSVFGHLEVKRGILLMLFGGVHKKTAEGISLRGDLNVCVVGDPSCAKSQFLKFVHGFLPRTVYTSGKSSSAAGLTASVVRDPDTGEFCVEAGALMLADNGICCIDEFDKMDPADQVAIHEAMEQQTISITKAGIQATLNARTSILAAANPVFGRYDRSKTLKANVAISAAIMSRFDLFFVILDECNPVIDEAIARHIIRVHKAEGMKSVNSDVPFTREQLQRYIRFARTMNPALSQESMRVLVECYRLLRQNDMLGKNKTAYRITVRQLESLVRLSEALARLHLDETIQPVYVREAYRLLQKSIIFIETEDIELEENEGEMDSLHQQHQQSATAAAGGYEVGDLGAGSGDGEGESAAYEAAAAAGVPAVGSKRTGGDDEAATESGATATTTTAAAGEGGAKKQKTKTSTHITAREYDDATQLLALRLKHLEDVAGDEFKGCLWRDLLAWYLKQFEVDLTSEEVFEAKKKVANQIIRRMIKHEGSIIVITSEDDDNAAAAAAAAAASGSKENNENKLLRLHPSYQG